MIESLRALGQKLAQAARLMIGLPDYEHYLAHMRCRHPARLAMSPEEFFRNRQEARYGGKGRMRGCC